MKTKINAGFTLLELLVAIGIIAVLVAIGTSSYSIAQKKSRDSKVRTDIKDIQNSLEAYYSTEGNYAYAADLETISGYFSQGSVPTHPKGGDYAYNYTLSTDSATYCLCGDLEMVNTGNATDDGTAGSGVCTFATGEGADYYCVNNLQ